MKGAERAFPLSFIIAILLLEGLILAGGAVFHRVREERVLAATFGPAYADYRSKTWF